MIYAFMCKSTVAERAQRTATEENTRK